MNNRCPASAHGCGGAAAPTCRRGCRRSRSRPPRSRPAPPAPAPRRAPRSLAAICARRSRLRSSGSRLFSATRRSMPRSSSPAAADAGRRDADALLEDAQRVGRDRARHPAADIGVMADIGGEEARPAVDKHRRHDRDVGHMRAGGEIGVVAEEGVAFRHLGERELAQHRLDRAEQRARDAAGYAPPARSACRRRRTARPSSPAAP